MKFYYAPMSCAFATHVVLEDAEAKYEAIKISNEANRQINVIAIIFIIPVIL